MCTFPSSFPFVFIRADAVPLVNRNKAVADGAISFYLDHRVGARMSRFTYGVNCHVPYNPSDEDHKMRSICSWLSPSGARRLPGFFSVILPKVCFPGCIALTLAGVDGWV